MNNKKILFVMVSIACMIVLLAAGMFGQTLHKNSLYRHLSIFTEVFSLVRSSYVEEAPQQKLVEGAFSGVTEGVDEFSYYIPPAQMTQYRAFLSGGSRDTRGVLVTKRFGYGYVIAPVVGSSAERAGIRAGDFIEQIGGVHVEKMAVWQIQNALRGTSAAPVTVTLIRAGMNKREVVNLAASPLVPPSISTRQIGGIRYVKVPTFEAGAAASLARTLDSAAREGSQKLIIDIRGNGVGSFEEAANAADRLLSRGLITALAGRRVEKKSWPADPQTSYAGDLLVLVDDSTSGPAEVFASAIHGNRRGRLVGVNTYGNAGLQKLVTLPSGGGLFITIGHYTTPDLKPIKAQGVRPDVVVDMTAVALATGAAEPGASVKEEDVILEKALRLFGEQVVKAAA